MVDSAIQWTQNTWNPWHGCHKVSAGCKFCYMFREKKMYGQDPNIVLRSKTKFKDPLRWPKEPTLCFTCSWSDWLIEEADAWRDEAYGIIRATPWITYQILTKRIERAGGRIPDPPLPNVWWGVSVEDQKTADERIPLLLETPATVRFVSYEPALGPVNFRMCPVAIREDMNEMIADIYQRVPEAFPLPRHLALPPLIDWLIVGGESGPGARPFDIDWARNTIDQCKAAGVACFFKQAGSSPVLDGTCIRLHDRKGGDLRELPPDLNIREFPDAVRATATVVNIC